MPLGRRAADELHLPVTEAMDFAPPLRLERRRADDEHLLDPRLPGKQLGHADPLDRFPEAHFVGENCPSRTHGKRDPVELIRQEFGFEQLLP